MDMISKAQPQREHLAEWERYAEWIVLVMMLLLGGFFVWHQVAQTGFFTKKFGVFEMVCLYLPIVLSLPAPVIRSMTGRRNPARPFEIMANVCLVLGALWFLNVLPFNFTHLGDPLPAIGEFVWGWVTDWFGRAILILQVIAGGITAISALIKYMSVTWEEQPPASHAV